MGGGKTISDIRALNLKANKMNRRLNWISAQLLCDINLSMWVKLCSHMQLLPVISLPGISPMQLNFFR